MVQPLEFGYRSVISSHTLLYDYISKLRLKLIHVIPRLEFRTD